MADGAVAIFIGNLSLDFPSIWRRKFMRNVNWRGSMRFPLRYGNCWNWIHSSSLQLNYLKCHRLLSLLARWRKKRKRLHKEELSLGESSVASHKCRFWVSTRSESCAKKKEKLSADFSAKFRIRRGTWKTRSSSDVRAWCWWESAQKNHSANELPPLRILELHKLEKRMRNRNNLRLCVLTCRHPTMKKSQRGKYFSREMLWRVY